jgi:hypothetical protein
MGKPGKRSVRAKAMLNKHGKFDVPGIDSLVSGLCGEDEDDDLLEITTDEQTTDRLIEERIQDVDVNALSGLFLRWSNLACTATPRRGNSGRQQRRKALHAIKLANCMPRGALLKYFAVVQEQDYHIDGHFPDMALDEPPAVNETVATMQIAQTTLKAGLALIHNNARLEKRNKELSFFCKLQYLSVLQYFQTRLLGAGRVAAAVVVATAIFSKVSPDSYKSRCILSWADQYLSCGRIAQSRQGKHPKTHSIIFDEAAKEIVRGTQAITTRGRQVRCVLTTGTCQMVARWVCSATLPGEMDTSSPWSFLMAGRKVLSESSRSAMPGPRRVCR